MNGKGLTGQIGFFSATILVVANMVGTGIFTTSGFIIEELGNPQTMLLCWLVGGVIALCGALCYGELSAMFPRAGGEYVFLRESFGSWMGFLSGWISLIVGFSAPIAAVSVAFSTYLLRSFSLSSGSWIPLPIIGVEVASASLLIGLGAGMILTFSLIHYSGLLMGSRVQNGLTLFKVVLIVIFIVAGLCSGNGSSANFGGALDLKAVFQGKFAVSLIFISFAYSGWNAAAYLGSEIRKAHRNIPLALITGTCIVTFIYLLLNVVYIYALSPDKMAGVLEVGARSAVHLFGESTSRYFSGAIALCLLSVLSAMIMAGPRVYYAMARDGIFFRVFGQVSKAHRTPSYSVFLQSGIAIVMVITASFDKLLLYIGFTLSLFATLAVVGMMVLRIKKPGLDREYRAFGYPITPFLFILGNAWIVYFTVKSRPVTALFGSATIAMGILAYLFFRNRRNQGRPYETHIALG